MNRIALLSGASLVLAAGAAVAQSSEPNEVYYSVLVDYFAAPDLKHVPLLDDGVGIDVRYGQWGGPRFGWEVRGFYGQVEPTDPNATTRSRGGATFAFTYRMPTFLGGFSPYAVAGAGLAYTNAIPEKDRAGVLADFGAGILTPTLFTWFDAPIRARGEYRIHLEDLDQEYVDSHVLLGLEAAWGKPPPAPPPAPEPVQVVDPEPVYPEPEPEPAPKPLPPPEPAGPADGDGDGVLDADDRCPNTPPGKDVDSEGCVVLKVLTLRGVNFELNSAGIKTDSYPVLDEAVAALSAEFPNARIEVAGHTDSTGAASYNQDLSRRRAESVRDYLSTQGIDAERLIAVGYGEAEPVADNGTREGRADNRRVELRVKEGADGSTGSGRHSLNPNQR